MDQSYEVSSYNDERLVATNDSMLMWQLSRELGVAEAQGNTDFATEVESALKDLIDTYSYERELSDEGLTSLNSFLLHVRETAKAETELSVESEIDTQPVVEMAILDEVAPTPELAVTDVDAEEQESDLVVEEAEEDSAEDSEAERWQDMLTRQRDLPANKNNNGESIPETNRGKRMGKLLGKMRGAYQASALWLATSARHHREPLTAEERRSRNRRRIGGAIFLTGIGLIAYSLQMDDDQFRERHNGGPQAESTVPPDQISPEPGAEMPNTTEAFTIDPGHGYTQEIADTFPGYAPLEYYGAYHAALNQFGSDFIQGVPKYAMGNGDWGLANTGIGAWAPGVEQFLQDYFNHLG